LTFVSTSNISNAAKEVKWYREALYLGFKWVREKKLLLKKYIVAIQQRLEDNDAGIRTQSGTAFKNASTGEVARIKAITQLIQETKVELRDKLPKLYSKDLLEILFKHPYTKNRFNVSI